MTTQQVSDVLGLTTQQVRNLARLRKWKVLRAGRTGVGLGNLYSHADVAAEVKDRLQEARRMDDRLKEFLRQTKQDGEQR